VSLSTPLSVEIAPFPSVSPPCHTADALRKPRAAARKRQSGMTLALARPRRQAHAEIHHRRLRQARRPGYLPENAQSHAYLLRVSAFVTGAVCSRVSSRSSQRLVSSGYNWRFTTHSGR
jgi:hypothetical protein